MIIVSFNFIFQFINASNELIVVRLAGTDIRLQALVEIRNIWLNALDLSYDVGL